MKLSIGLISNILLLFEKVVSENKIIINRLNRKYFNLNFETESLLIFASECSWLKPIDENILVLTDKGVSIFEKFQGDELKADLVKEVLYDYILLKKPSWSYRIPYGRKEATIYMSLDEKQCFYLAGLLVDEINDECMKWWDDIATHIRVLDSIHKSDIGRRGEVLSIDYETKRTGLKPYWNSFETNLNGYDLLSVIDKDCDIKLSIEVKATTKDISHATFFLTKNEWHTAKTSKNYIFHIWLVSDTNKIAVISVEEMKKHIPQNSGYGEWKQVEISFAAFHDKFEIYDNKIYPN